MKKRGLIALPMLAALTLLLLCTATYAVDFSVDVKPVVDRFEINKNAEFVITIKNSYDTADTFFLSNAKDTRFIIETEPPIDYISGITINPHATKSTTLYIRTSNNTLPARYIFPLQIISLKTNTSIDKDIDLTVLPYSYEPNISVVTSKAQIDPRQKSNFRILVKNNNPLVMNNITMVVRGNLIKESVSFDLNGNEEKSIAFTLDFGKKTEPQTDTVSIVLSWKNQILYNGIEKIEVLPYGTSLDKSYSYERKLLRSVETINLSNPTNSVITEEFTVRAGLIDRIFSKTEPKARIIKQNGKKYFAWQYTLKQDESTLIKITRDFTIPAIVLLIVIIACLYFISSGPAMIMRKEVTDVKSDQESIKEVTIKIRMKNKKPYPLKEARLVDRLPAIAKVDKEKSENPPSRVFKSIEHGQVAEWSLGDFDPGQIKEITYTISASLAVIGTLELKSAMCKYLVNGKKKKSHSNSTGVTLAKKPEEE